MKRIKNIVDPFYEKFGESSFKRYDMKMKFRDKLAERDKWYTIFYDVEPVFNVTDTRGDGGSVCSITDTIHK